MAMSTSAQRSFTRQRQAEVRLHNLYTEAVKQDLTGAGATYEFGFAAGYKDALQSLHPSWGPALADVEHKVLYGKPTQTAGETPGG